jgi:hypothetical protein
LGFRDLEYSQTISFDKRSMARDKEDMVFAKIKKHSRKLPSEKKYTQYAGAVQNTYDAVLDNSLSILRNFTLDDRISRMKAEKMEKQVRDAYLYHLVFSIRYHTSPADESKTVWSGPVCTVKIISGNPRDKHRT